MKIVIQRVTEANVSIDGNNYAQIKNGLMILVGIVKEDTENDVKWLTNKVLNLRIFDDEKGIMNKSVLDVKGDLLVISQFTLHSKTKKGNRPSYIDAAPPELSIPIYNDFVSALQKGLERRIQTGKFGANMQVGLINDGPVTIIIDSQNRE